MDRCALCLDQVKRDEEDARLGFDFTPEELIKSAFYQGCDSCLVILEGLRQSETPDWSFQRDIRRVYTTCHSKRGSFQDTLRLEIYFIDDRPKLELEYYSLQPHSARETGIPWASIPRTFQDVMQLTLQLGFRYIWIDSLCIIQDDVEDWEIQSSLMSEIYQDAILTIAATSSTGDNEGCCPRKVHHHTPDIEISLPEYIGTCRIAVRKPLKHWDAAQNAASILHDFPLLTRGWAFQERLLSPRVLHICEAELVWECREANVCECGSLSQQESPGGAYHHAVESNQEEKRQHDITQQELTQRVGALRLEQKDSIQIQAGQRTDAESDCERPPAYEPVVSPNEMESYVSSDVMLRPRTPEYDLIAFAANSNVPLYQDVTPVNEAEIKDCPDLVFHFHRIVEQYSALKLTRPSDRLTALSGLCKRVHHLRNNYLAGLWSDSICFDLLWRVNTIKLSTEESGTRPTDYRGPTWSWVSVGSPVSYWSDIINFRVTYEGFPTYSNHAAGLHADKIEMAVNVPGQNRFGTVTSAILTIEASATTGTLRYTYDPHWLGGKGNHDPVRYKLEITISRYDSNEPVEVPFFADYSLGAEGAALVPADSELTLLLIHPKVCLVLRPASRPVAPTIVKGVAAWERVGIARISDALLNYYHIDWMSGSEVKKFHIV
ncbi:heterokaryon incompatibility protein-domain-containing protein [Phaeosphaeriaceae sp. PMI808]|nr:heterokaryon incompatibility protein-domain-containing protein [Phaeosphaeriaceae sp. PMI808]